MEDPMHAPVPPRPRPGLLAITAALALTAAMVPAAYARTSAGPAPTVERSAAVEHGASVQHTADGVEVTVPASADGPGYSVEVSTSPFRISTVRGGETVLATAATGPSAFTVDTGSGPAGTTEVTDSTWDDGTLDLSVATDQAGTSLEVRITPAADRYDVRTSVVGGDQGSIAANYAMASAGHWYGHGEAITDEGGPYRDQPWPLDDQSDSGTVTDGAFGPASYDMIEPFWFTQEGSGIFVDTTHLMRASLGGDDEGVAGLTVRETDALQQTVFVEETARAVYEDYIGITGTPEKSDAPDYQYRTPVWNSWAQFYTDVNQDDFVEWARGIHGAGIPAHTFNLDDGWMSHYGDFTFNDKFPDPQAMSDAVHALGSRFGLWVTLWINLDADNYQVARDNGYLLKSESDPSQPCQVNWWNGTAGIVDLANPEARQWYVDQLHGVQEQYDVDGFKFDTRFFDERCAPYSSDLTMADYQRLGADMADEFDLQGMGIRSHWTGSQTNGFVIRQIDKSTDWASLNAAVAQNLALSTVGYPFVTTDMIGGSLGGFPPSKQVLVRWAQAAAAMPLMYSSSSPLGVSNFAGSREYDAETVQLYKDAVDLHGRLAPYILEQVDRAVDTGEPIMKPLFFDYPDDPAGYPIDDQWLLGDSLLVAPVLGDETSRDIHVPAGRWFDVTTQRVVRGPADLHDYQAGLDTVPLFVRLGSPDSGTLLDALQ
jgi:alpha-glucosidase (family GH31 glycosyl hydrolase)